MSILQFNAPKPKLVTYHSQDFLRFHSNVILSTKARAGGIYKNENMLKRPINTATKAVIVRTPLIDLPEGPLKVIIDGKTYLPVTNGKITELMQVSDSLLTSGFLPFNYQLHAQNP